MINKIIAIQGNHPSKLNPKTDTSIFLANEIQNKKYKKPDPAGFFEISKKLKIPSEEFIFLGDTGIDMKTAVAAGCFPVGALWGFRHEKELINNGARALVKKPIEILDLLDV